MRAGAEPASTAIIPDPGHPIQTQMEGMGATKILDQDGQEPPIGTCVNLTTTHVSAFNFLTHIAVLKMHAAH